ncbi:hypothetical protein ACFP2F_04420 [Hymenobacter artigasi]|uniref:Tetratricopeptide repeat protein n=1 Tax=Hymenobacter artigasi TaxID=2719616 RepID=A0ABX1HIG6_9BACT|nr:hypothetical protein [Hymenobacter artigasi]NKI88852.1 hypothetical protein [Hymenobacter artigasi]
MDDLRTTLLTLSPDDRRDFGRFIQRQRRKTIGRLDSRLYELLVRAKELKTEQLIAQLYPDEPNPTAYYALRKRLMRHLTDYLLLRQRQLDTTAAATVRGHLTLAQYLFEAGIPRLAWNTLRKAEKLGRETEQHEQLNAVYNLQIQHASSPYAEPLDEILPRYRLNKKAADEEERANIADSLLRQRLRESRVRGRATVSVDAILQNILAEYDLQEAFARSPALLSRLMSITRSAMLVRRDFTSFAVFIERCYNLMERRHGFAPAQRGHQLKLLYMLAHALYRSRRFAESVVYLEKGTALMSAGPGQPFSEFAPRFTFLLAGNYAFLRRNAESIGLLEAVLRGPKALTAADDLTARLQLTFHYFAEGKFAKANQVLLSLARTDHWLEQHLGLEWLLNRNIGEMLIQIELDNGEQALTRLRAIERTIRDLFPAVPADAAAATEAVPVGGPYHPVLIYLGLVRELIENPATAHSHDFGNRVTHLPPFISQEREDLQVISFYSWLRARSLGRPYYEVLLEIANA